MSKYLKTLIILLFCLSLTFSELEIIQGKQGVDTDSVHASLRMLQNGGQGFAQFPEQQTSNTLELEGNGQPLQFGTFQPIAQQGAAGTANSQQTQQSVNSEQAPVQGSPSQTGTVVDTSNAQNLTPAKKEEPKILMTEVGKPVLGKGFKVDDGISYQRLSIKDLEKKYLFLDFKLAEKDKWQQVNITITQDGTQMIVANCMYDGHDSCYLSGSQLRKDEVLFLTIKCQDECTYNLNTRWSDTEHMKPGDRYVFKFGKDNFQIYHVELGDAKFQEFRVHVAPRATQRPFENVKIYGKYGQKNPSPEDFDFKSINLWQDGEGLFLSSKEMKQKNMYLLLVGQSDTSYQLSCDLITEQNHEITNGEHVYEYMAAGGSKSYHIAEFDTLKFEQFSLRVSVLSGYVQIDYYLDKELKNKLPIDPFKYMDDSEYIFDAKQIAQFAAKGLYVKITSTAQDGQEPRDTTYTIKFNGRRKSEGIELNEHVYGFIALKEQRFAYFNFKKWISETEMNTNMKFTVSTLEVLGKVDLEFRICKTLISYCTDLETFENSSIPLKINSHDVIGEKRIYELEIESSQLKMINAVEKEGIIVVSLKATKDEKRAEESGLDFSLIAVEFVNNNKVLYLREDRPLEEKLTAGSMKLYKYINSDPNVKEIRVHVNDISGIVKFNGVSKDPDSQQAVAIAPEANTLRFVSHLNWPIIVSVQADTRAIFGISMQVILKNEFHGEADIIPIGEDLSYTVRIKPQTYTIFQVTPMFYNFIFSYESSQSVITCALNMTTGNCISDTEDRINAPRLNFKGNVTNAQLSKDRKGRIKITNPFSDSVAEVTVIFHSRHFDHCEAKTIGKVYSDEVKNGTCYSYLIQEQEDQGVQIYISKREFSNMQYSVFVCGNSISNANKAKTVTLAPSTIKDRCKNSIQSKRVTILWDVTTNNAGSNDYTVKVDFVVQKLGGLTMLPEGLSYKVIEQSRDGILKKFGFSIINPRDTTIYIRQNIGKFKAFAKIIKDQDRQIEEISEINYHFSSSNTVDYSQDPVIKIPKKSIEDSSCTTCAILIAVFSDGQREAGRTVEFQIEVVQIFQRLTDEGSVTGYLETGSFSYYSYSAKRATDKPTTLIFFISDHNQQCANMYLSLIENPGPKNNIANVFQGNELLYSHNGPEARYFLAVEAVTTCDYALSVLQLDSSIHRLERGKQNMLKLSKGQIRYFTFQQYTNEPFKIISLSKFGEVRLYLNVSSQPPNKKTWTTNQLDTAKFQIRSGQTNTLSVSNSDKIFCTKCDYFVAAQALTTTFSTLFLVYPKTVVPLLKNKFFSDYFSKKGESTMANYNNVQKTKLYVTVHSGSLEITALYKNDFKSSTVFKAKAELQVMEIDIEESITDKSVPTGTSVDPYYNDMSKTQKPKERVPINFEFKAVDDKTSYTLQIKSVAEKGDMAGFVVERNILAGEPNHIEISNEKVTCIEGHLRQKNEQILISVNSDSQGIFDNLIFNAKLRSNQAVNFTKQVHKNLLTLKLIDPTPQQNQFFSASKYQVCMKIDTVELEKKEEKEEENLSEEDKEKIVENGSEDNETVIQEQFQEEEKEVVVRAVVTQINSVNVLQSDTDTVVRGTNTFVVHSDGQFLLDVLECKGDAKVTVGESLTSLDGTKEKMLESVGMSQQRHAVKISQSDVAFIKISSEHSVVRWLPINYESEEGLGYLRFSAGDLRYSSVFKKIRVEFQPLQWVKKTKSSVEKVEYKLYISNSSESIEYASRCDPDSSIDVIQLSFGQIPFNGYADKQKNFQYYDVDKNYLQEKYNGSDYIYISVVAKATLKLSPKVEKNPRFQTPITDEHQHYRFIYNRQQMPLESYTPTKIEEIPYHFLVMIVGSIVLVLLLCTWLFTRKIAPMIARLRSSNLVEEPDIEPPANKDDLQVVPPSSDRNQRVAEIQIQTQEGMK